MSMLGMPALILWGDRALALPAGAALRIVRVGDVDAFARVLRGGVPAGYIVSGRLDAEVRAILAGVQLAVPDAHLVVGAVDEGDVNPQHAISGDRTALVSPLPDPAEVAFLGRRAWFGARIELLRRHNESRPLHWLVRRAIHTVMSERFRLSDSSARRRLEPVRSVRDLSARCGASEKTLRRYCRESGVVVGEFISDWKVMLAVWARLLEGRRSVNAWDRVARCLGYRDESGVRKLLTRRLHSRAEPGSLSLDDLDRIIRRLETSLVGGA